MATTASKTPAIYAKIAKIQAEVGAIPKTGVGPANKGSFAFIRAEDILDKIHALLVAQDVIVRPTITHTDFVVNRDSGRAYTNATVKAEYEFIAVEDGSTFVVTSVGEGSDIGSDTATRKAATMAMKIAHLHTFTIPNTNELSDDEGYEPTVKAEAAAKASPKAVSAAQKASTPSAGADAKQENITKLRAAVKVAAAPLNLTATELNDRGAALSSDFFNDPAALKSLAETLTAEAAAKK